MECYGPQEKAVTDPAVAADLLALEMRRQARGAEGVEPPTAAMFSRILQEQGYPLKPVLDEAAEFRIIRGGMKSSPAMSAVRSALIHHFRQRIPDFSDAHRLSPEDWDEPVELLKEDLRRFDIEGDSGRVGAFFFDLDVRPTATPIKSRYYLAELFAQLGGSERFPRGIRALDVGSSVMVGAQQLMSKDEFPMSFERVVIAPDDRDEYIDVTENAERLVARKSIFKEIVCVDSYPVYWETRGGYDTTLEEFAISCMRPSERSNKTYQDTVKALMAKDKKASNINFMWADLLTPSGLATFKEQYPEKFDMILVNYVTQELPPHDQRRLHHILGELLHKPGDGGGIILYVHPAYTHPVNVTQPVPIRNVRHYETHVKPFRHSMHLVDNLYVPEGVQEVMSFRNNRCQDILVRASGGLMVRGTFQSIPDLLQDS